MGLTPITQNSSIRSPQNDQGKDHGHKGQERQKTEQRPMQVPTSSSNGQEGTFILFPTHPDTSSMRTKGRGQSVKNWEFIARKPSSFKKLRIHLDLFFCPWGRGTEGAWQAEQSWGSSGSLQEKRKGKLHFLFTSECHVSTFSISL